MKSKMFLTITSNGPLDQFEIFPLIQKNIGNFDFSFTNPSFFMLLTLSLVLLLLLILFMEKEESRKSSSRKHRITFNLEFPCSNNSSEYEALAIGLSIAKEMKINKLKVVGD